MRILAPLTCLVGPWLTAGYCWVLSAHTFILQTPHTHRFLSVNPPPWHLCLDKGYPTHLAGQTGVTLLHVTGPFYTLFCLPLLCSSFICFPLHNFPPPGIVPLTPSNTQDLQGCIVNYKTLVCLQLLDSPSVTVADQDWFLSLSALCSPVRYGYFVSAFPLFLIFPFDKISDQITLQKEASSHSERSSSISVTDLVWLPSVFICQSGLFLCMSFFVSFSLYCYLLLHWKVFGQTP